MHRGTGKTPKNSVAAIGRTGAGSFGRSRAAIASFPGKLLIALARLYQKTVGIMLPDACRFTPTCSQYFIEAVRRHGAVRGAWLGFRRLMRCNQFFKGGHDPVP